MSEPYVCVRQRAGPLVKALITDNYAYLRRYGPGAVRGRCGPALSRTSLDKLELRLALFGYDGIFYDLTFDDAHLPPNRAGVERVWDAFLKRLRHPWGCSRALSKYIPPPEVTTCKSGMVRLPKGATPLPMQGRDRPQLGGWGLYGYSRYLLPEK